MTHLLGSAIMSSVTSCARLLLAANRGRAGKEIFPPSCGTNTRVEQVESVLRESRSRTQAGVCQIIIFLATPTSNFNKNVCNLDG